MSSDVKETIMTVASKVKMSSFLAFLLFQRIYHLTVRYCNSQFDWNLLSLPTKLGGNPQYSAIQINPWIVSHMDNYMLYVLELANLKISVSAPQTTEQQNILNTHKYFEIKNVRNFRFFFFFPLNKTEPQQVWPGTVNSIHK